MKVEELQWPAALPVGLISSDEIHVWRLCLGTITSSTESFCTILSADELTRAAKFHFKKDQDRFIISRGALRIILSSYLNQNPQEICFEYTSFGKPLIAAQFASDISFNLSHSGDMVVYAIASHRQIGIDVERVREHLDVMQIARRFFSSKEISDMENIDEKSRPELFFMYWSRKEAFVKGLGKGVSFPMEHIDVSSVTGNCFIPVQLPGENQADSCLYVRDLVPGEGYTGAIAASGKNPKVFCWNLMA